MEKPGARPLIVNPIHATHPLYSVITTRYSNSTSWPVHFCPCVLCASHETFSIVCQALKQFSYGNVQNPYSPIYHFKSNKRLQEFEKMHVVSHNIRELKGTAEALNEPNVVSVRLVVPLAILTKFSPTC